MSLNIHFVSGLPRSGSTLLAAILRQNPGFRASMSGPVADVFTGVLRTMSWSETSLFISDEQRKRVLRSVVESYYADMSTDRRIFDTNRVWCSVLPALSEIFPASRMICCLRNPAWILDSVERLVQRNAFRASKMFTQEVPANVYGRVDALTKGFLAGPLNALKQAWFGEHAQRLIAVRYESLTERPAQTIKALYDLLGEESFAHDYENLEYEEPEFDNRLNMPGLHSVRKRVEAVKRQPVLPPDLFNQNDREFWDMPGQNPRNVTIL